MLQHESDWYEQVRRHRAKAEAATPSKKRKKDWDEALVAPSEKELEAREEKAKDRDWLYIEQRREVYSTVKLAWDDDAGGGEVGGDVADGAQDVRHHLHRKKQRQDRKSVV